VLGLPRIAFVLATSVIYLAWHGHHHAAFAKGDDSEEDGGDDGDDKGDSGEDTEGDDGDEDAKDQPPVTAGGLFTISTYPVRELNRPLTMTEHIGQVRVGLGTDVSAKGAFSTGGLSVDAIYGLKDNFSVIGGVTDAYNFKQFSIYAGFEAALAYDVFDVRVAANVHRFAIPRFCGVPGDPTTQDMNAPATCDANSAALPDGNYDPGHTQFSIDLGFPFRYSFTPQIAIVALQTLISIDFNGHQRGTDDEIKAATALGHPAYCNAINAAMTDANGQPFTADLDHCIENGAKPDLNPSLGVATNPVPPLSVVIFAQLRIPDFDTSAGNFQVPVTARVEFSPNQKLDVGLDFTLLNVKPPDPQSPIDNRFVSLFLQTRI
jgi:hypothetical protein